MEPEDSKPGTHDWTGALGEGPGRLRLRLRAPNGFFGPVTLFSLDQGAAPIPGQAETSASGQVTIKFPALRAMFVGRVEGQQLIGKWFQRSQIPLTLTKGEAGLAPPPVAILDQDRLIALRTAAGSPALAAAAQRPGRSALLMADGLRAAGEAAAVTTQDRWHIGSITKSMTATLAARLIEAGRLSWDDTIAGVLGATVPEIHAAYRPLTLCHLLSHRSGLDANLPMLALQSFRAAKDSMPTQRRAYTAQALKAQPKGPPESTFLYSNSGFVVAGAMLEAKTGQPWETLLRQALFEPLGMVGAGFGPPGRAEALEEPLGHSKALFGERRHAHRIGREVTDNPEVLGPAGTVHARLADMLAYLAAHRDRPALLGPASWDRLHTPPFGGDYALGWTRNGAGQLWHNGSNTLWYAEAMIDSGAQAGVAFAAANDGHLEKAQPAVAAALSGILAR